MLARAGLMKGAAVCTCVCLGQVFAAGPVSSQDLEPSFEFTIPLDVREVRREVSSLRIACSVFGAQEQELASSFEDQRLTGGRFSGTVKVAVDLPESHHQDEAASYRCQLRFIVRGKEVVPTNTVRGTINSARARTQFAVLQEGKL